MKKYIGIFILLLFISCYSKQYKEYGVIDTNQTNSYSISDFSFSTTDDLISTIELSENIESEHIGFNAEKSYIYSCYTDLLEVASDSLWLELSYSKSAVMRYYAYKALLSKESTNLHSIRNRLIKDTSHVCLYAMDIMICNLTLGNLILIEEMSENGN